MKKIRFAIGLRDFCRRKGGAERYLADLCTRLANEGHEVHVYAEHWDEGNPGISFHRVKTIPFPRSLRLLSFATRATRAIGNGNYDITFGVGNTLRADVLQPHGGVHWAWFWRSLKVYQNPVLLGVKFLGRVLSPKQWVSGWIEDAPYRKRNFREIIAISDMVKRDMVRWYQIPEGRIHVVYNGVDIERFHPRNRRYREEVRRRHRIRDELVILFVSNNFRMKGLGYLMRALADLKKEEHPPFKLLVLGRDRQGPYQRLAKKIGIFEETIFAGSANDPEQYYGASDLLVHPSFYDACSLTVLEGLASGLPVITTASNGASGVIRRGDEGWVIDGMKTHDEIKVAIRYFFDDEIRRQASCRGRIKAEVYSETSNFEQMLGMFNQVITSMGRENHRFSQEKDKRDSI